MMNSKTKHKELVMAKKKKKSKKQDSRWASIASLIEGETKDDNDYIKVARDYKPKKGKEFKAPGRLIYHDFESDQFFELSTISLFEPHENAPDYITDNLCINLANEKQCEDITDELDYEGEEDEDEDEDEEEEEEPRKKKKGKKRR